MLHPASSFCFFQSEKRKRALEERKIAAVAAMEELEAASRKADKLLKEQYGTGPNGTNENSAPSFFARRTAQSNDVLRKRLLRQANSDDRFIICTDAKAWVLPEYPLASHLCGQRSPPTCQDVVAAAAASGEISTSSAPIVPGLAETGSSVVTRPNERVDIDALLREGSFAGLPAVSQALRQMAQCEASLKPTPRPNLPRVLKSAAQNEKNPSTKHANDTGSTPTSSGDTVEDVTDEVCPAP